MCVWEEWARKGRVVDIFYSYETLPVASIIN